MRDRQSSAISDNNRGGSGERLRVREGTGRSVAEGGGAGGCLAPPCSTNPSNVFLIYVCIYYHLLLI
jgi:hypothetical protein